MADDEEFVKELELIQNIIDRQADNSFKIKGWTITLVVVTLLFRQNDIQVIVAFVPLFVFWYLDAYYLRLERQYRELYNRVRKDPGASERERFNMDPPKLEDDKDKMQNIMVSRSVILLYGTIIVLLGIYAVFTFVSGDPSVQAANVESAAVIVLCCTRGRDKTRPVASIPTQTRVHSVSQILSNIILSPLKRR